MHVALDSNVLIADRWLRSRHLDALLDYLDRTNSLLFIHEIVNQEVRAKVRQQFAKAVNSMASAAREGERLGMVGINSPEESVIVAASMSKWEKMFGEWLNRNAEVIPLDNDLLPEITRRAIERIPPFTSNGEEFRDALLWLGLIRHLPTVTAIPEVAFISANTKQFASIDKHELHPSLASDAKAQRIDVHYFTSLDDFISSRAKPIEHISVEWINEHLNGAELTAAIHAYLDTLGPDFFVPAHMYENRYQAIEVPDPMSVTYSLVDFFVWQATGGDVTVFLSFEVTAFGDAECESLFSAQARWETEQDSLYRTLPCRLHRKFDVTAELKGDIFKNFTVEDSEPLLT
ncbi:MAG TPA: PIN domain-containing protein [Longimicrobium sp.]|jgi:hypothetical protein